MFQKSVSVVFSCGLQQPWAEWKYARSLLLSPWTRPQAALLKVLFPYSEILMSFYFSVYHI